MKLLCLSNGHGEDAIALRILRELQQHPQAPDLAALPIVGEGRAYQQAQIPIIGPVQAMPSGGFIYMDNRQLVRDLKGGLLQLTLAQFKTIRTWAKQGGTILAVGDIVPLLFAWLSGAPYAFIGTAKSEYYLRDEAGPLPQRRWSFEGWSGSVYLPWERWLMGHPRCKAVFPRDHITTQTLLRWDIPAYDLGNPMMDGLQVAPPPAPYNGEAELVEAQRPLVIALLPGSRPPEAYNNWEVMLQGVADLVQAFRGRSLVFLGAIAPGLNLETLQTTLSIQGWRPAALPSKPDIEDDEALAFSLKQATLVLSQRAFAPCLQEADLAIAMAGTATEQFVGLGKPALILPGEGPQFTPAFAEAQTRLLGPSVTLVSQTSQVAKAVKALLSDPDRLQLIAENGCRRMGSPGAAHRIAACLLEKL